MNEKLYSTTKVIVMKSLLGLLMTGLMVVGFVGCGGDSDSPTGPNEEITKGPQGQGEKPFGMGGRSRSNKL